MLTEVYQVLFAITGKILGVEISDSFKTSISAVAISLCAVVSLYHRPISKLIDIRRLKKKKVGKNHLDLVKANRLKKPNPSSILFFRKMQNYNRRYKMRINTISIECFKIMHSKNATLQRLLNLKPNPKWFFGKFILCNDLIIGEPTGQELKQSFFRWWLEHLYFKHQKWKAQIVKSSEDCGPSSNWKLSKWREKNCRQWKNPA